MLLDFVEPLGARVCAFGVAHVGKVIFGVNKYPSCCAAHLWPVYIMISELPKEH